MIQQLILGTLLKRRSIEEIMKQGRPRQMEIEKDPEIKKMVDVGAYQQLKVGALNKGGWRLVITRLTKA